MSKLEELAPHLGEVIWSTDPVGELNRRGLLALNFEGQHTGSPSDPIVVVAPSPIPPIQG